MRIVFNGLTLTSLVLAIGVAVLWVRSYGRTDGVSRIVLPDIADQIISQRGVILFCRQKCSWNLRSPTPGWGYSTQQSAFRSVPPSFALGGVRYTHATVVFGQQSVRLIQCEVPHWSLLAMSIALPITVGVRFAKSRGRSRRGCRSCGYDVRATPDRCPECGALQT